LTFRENGRPNPTNKDDNRQLSFVLQRIFRAFRNKDPNEKQQKAVPPNVILTIAQLVYRGTTGQGQLARLGFFFAMRSREYLKVPRAELGRTKILLLLNIRFVRNGKNVSHDNPALELSDSIAIWFEMQKKEEKNDTVYQHHKASGDQQPS
jgi:hypothetical protein